MKLLAQTEYKKYKKNKLRVLILMHNLYDLFTFSIKELIFDKLNANFKFHDVVVLQYYCWFLSRAAYKECTYLLKSSTRTGKYFLKRT